MKRYRLSAVSVRMLFAGAVVMTGAALLWASMGANPPKPAAWGFACLALVFIFGMAWRRFPAIFKFASTWRADLTRHPRFSLRTNPAQNQAWLKRVSDVIEKIRTAHGAPFSGAKALYELPWILVIGEPAAGKSTMLRHAGLSLTFPAADIDGPAMVTPGSPCECIVTNDGIVFDTAGSLIEPANGAGNWQALLDLLKKHRPRKPLDAVVIAASLSRLLENDADGLCMQAKLLRQRLQELTERLEVQVPVYLALTKTDAIAGFRQFFDNASTQEQRRIWGASFDIDNRSGTDIGSQFDWHFGRLVQGLRSHGMEKASAQARPALHSDLLAFPIAFSDAGRSLRSFVCALFENNRFQLSPIWRGFYFTSARQESAVDRIENAQIMQRFGLSRPSGERNPVFAARPFFVQDLFPAIIFTDRGLARHHVSPHRVLRARATFLAAILSLGLLLAAWTTSYLGNRDLIEQTQADLDKVRRIQLSGQDIGSRLEALMTLQGRLEQLQAYHDNKPFFLGLGLYQGSHLERVLGKCYLDGMRELLLIPVTDTLEQFLARATERQGQPTSFPDSAGASSAPMRASLLTEDRAGLVPAGKSPYQTYQNPSESNTEPIYNALKTYLMLAQKDHFDAGHLADQLPRFWRDWLEQHRSDSPRETVIRHAERLIPFFLSQWEKPGFPLVENKRLLVDKTRQLLIERLQGIPARERVYQDIKRRASMRFPALTAMSLSGETENPLITGSHAVPGAFSRQAWEQFVQSAIHEASRREVETVDWVLKARTRNDLSLEGSPEQIARELTRLYKTDYATEWKKFIQSLSIQAFADFNATTEGMNRLGDPVSSPMKTLMVALDRETSWDGPMTPPGNLKGIARHLSDWVSETVLRHPARALPEEPSRAPVDQSQTGLLAHEFNALAELVSVRKDDKHKSLLNGYLAQLALLKSRLNQMKTTGEAGPASLQLMKETFDGKGSELSSALIYVDENMLNGVPDAMRSVLRPLLVRPLMQVFSALIPPAERELNQHWMAEVVLPYRKGIGAKLPFSSTAREAASEEEIRQLFGPSGAIAHFLQSAMAPVTIQRGGMVAPRTWAGMGIRLDPAFTAALPAYLSSSGLVDGHLSESATGISGATRFQLHPLPAHGIKEFTIDIDGQRLHYAGGSAAWQDFLWPAPSGEPGARIQAISSDGQDIVFLDSPGESGLETLIASAQRQRLATGLHRLTWSDGKHSISMDFRLQPAAQTPSERKELVLPASIAGVNGTVTP